VQHTNTSSMSGGSTTSLFYRDLGARWLTTRSKKGIRRSNKNRPTLSKAPIYGWWRPAWNLSFEGRVGNVADGHGQGWRRRTRRGSRRARCSSVTTIQVTRRRRARENLDTASLSCTTSPIVTPCGRVAHPPSHRDGRCPMRTVGSKFKKLRSTIMFMNWL
jgi:hypothetical protein